MQCATIAYAPPPKSDQAQAFCHNISRYATHYPLHIYSDSDQWAGVKYHIDNPEVVRDARRPFTISNCVFLFGLRLALDLKLDYFLYLEDDCRVRGDQWDKVLFDEFFETKDAVVGGSPIAYNIAHSGHAALKRAIEFAWRYQQKTGFAMPLYGGIPGMGDQIAFYPNGAVAIYHTKTVADMFPGFSDDIGTTARRTTAWDLKIGLEMWRKFGISMFDRFAILTRSYSGYGETLVPEAARRHMLESGRVVAAHQFKGSYEPN